MRSKPTDIMFGTEEQFATDFAQSNIAEKARKVGYRAEIVDGGVLIGLENRKVTTREIRRALNVVKVRVAENGDVKVLV